MSSRSPELLAAQALWSARLLERALHSHEDWTIRNGVVEVPAQREVTEDGVVFSATFPSVCHLDEPEPNLTLLHDGEFASIMAIEHPGDTEFEVSWVVRPVVVAGVGS